MVNKYLGMVNIENENESATFLRVIYENQKHDVGE